MKLYAETDPLMGREIRLRKTCKTERAAQIDLGKLLEQASAGRQPETNATVAELISAHSAAAALPSLVFISTELDRPEVRYVVYPRPP